MQAQMDRREPLTVDGSRVYVGWVIGMLLAIQGDTSIITKEQYKERLLTLRKTVVDYVETHEGWPATIHMPCSKTWVVPDAQTMMSLPVKDIACTCGSPRHWFLKWDIRRSEE